MDSLKLESIFFEALNYPEYARPNFFIYKQRQSTWDRGTYLHTLAEVYHSCVTRLKLHYNANKRKIPGLKLDDVEIPIKTVTGGEENNNFNKKKIDQLFFAIQYSYYYDREAKNYSNIEILSLAEYALGFIRNEFKEQANESNNSHFRPRTKSYFIYLIAQDGPFLNFPKFKHAIRELLLFSPNKATIKNILEKYHTASREIVELWNNKIFFIEEAHNNEENIRPETIRVEFKAEELKHSWWNDIELFNIFSPVFFRNQDFASYAAKITNLLASEILDLKNQKPLEVKKLISLEDLFIDKKEFGECIEILRQIKPVAISPKNEFLLSTRSKGVFVAWIEALKQKGKLYPTDRKTLSELITNYFPGVNFGKDGKTFSNTHTSSYKKNYQQILNLIP